MCLLDLWEQILGVRKATAQFCHLPPVSRLLSAVQRAQLFDMQHKVGKKFGSEVVAAAISVEGPRTALVMHMNAYAILALCLRLLGRVGAGCVWATTCAPLCACARALGKSKVPFDISPLVLRGKELPLWSLAL
jgi:hypothetical protein